MEAEVEVGVARVRESSRGMMGSASQDGSGASRRVFEAESGEGWAWRRRCERWRQVGWGTEYSFSRRWVSSAGVRKEGM